MPGLTLRHLLRELRQNLLHDRSQQVSGTASDLLWSDETLVNYINEAQRRFAREALVIHDYTTDAVTLITTVAFQRFYPLHPSIVQVLSVKMQHTDSDGNIFDHQALPRAGFDAFSNYHTPDPIFFDPNQLEQMKPGKPVAWGTDDGVTADPNGSFGVQSFRFFPVPDTTYANIPYRLRVVREPINDLILSNLSAYPEIPAANHLDILDYAAYLALRNVDLDIAGGNAPQRADQFEARFNANCARAKALVMRKLFAPLQFGFGRNGFSWEQ